MTKTTPGIACKFAETHNAKWEWVGLTRVQEAKNSNGVVVAYADATGYYIASPLSNPF